MRILFTFIGGNGHFVPLIPVARAALAAGHTVAFGCGPSLVATVQAAGFSVFPLGTGNANPPDRLPLRPLDAAREDQEFRDHFARTGAQSGAPHTRALCAEWQPDVLVCDETDFGGMVSAESLGLPHVTVLVMAAGSFIRAEVIGDSLNELRALYGLAPDSGIEMVHRDLVLSPFPPAFRDPAFPLPRTAFSFCPVLPQLAQPISPLLSQVNGLPTVYFTLGTVFNMESGNLFARVLAGLRDLPVHALVTVGPHIDPAEFGPQPAHIQIERYIAQESILPHCNLVISHGGSGSVTGALAYGRPSVLIPMGADQPLNAARCAQLGLARVLDPIATTSEDVRVAVTKVLSNPSYQQAADRLRTEFVSLPGPSDTIQYLEQWVAVRPTA